MTDFFIIGPPRSGGTLLYSIICSDSDTNPVLTENHFVTDMAATYAHACNRIDIEQGHFFTGTEDAREFFSECIGAFLNRIRNRYTPARHLAIKSITLGTHYREIATLLPQARFLVSIRDPRDIVASLIAVGERQVAAGKNNQYPRDIEALTQRVMRNYVPSLMPATQDWRDRTFFVKYEELTSRHELILSKLAEWSGLDLSGFKADGNWPSTLRDFNEEKSRDPFLTGQYGSGISSRSVGRYRSVLTKGEIATAERIAAPLMQAFRYPRQDAG